MSNNILNPLKKKPESFPLLQKYLTDSSWQESGSPINRYQKVLEEQNKVIIDWVHEPLEYSDGLSEINDGQGGKLRLNTREKVIINRLRLLRSDPRVMVKEIIDDLHTGDKEFYRGKIVIIGGGIEDVCCEQRYLYLREIGAIPVIDLALTTLI